MKNSLTVIGGILILVAVVGMGATIDWSNILPDLPIVDVTPDPGPSPIVGEGLHVLIVEETADRHKLPAGQQEIIGSVRLRNWLKEQGAEFRVEDQDDSLEFASKKWQDAIKSPRQSVPWVYASNGNVWFSEPLPQSVDELLEKLKALQDG